MDLEGFFFDTNDFELTNKKIGEGSYGKVFIITNINSGKQYAAKIINVIDEFDSHEQMMLLRETSILHKLNHPSIVRFYGINFHSFNNPDKLEPTIITEYLSHGSLKEILKKEQNSIADDNWSPTKKYICLLGIADAMRYLHKHGIIHRDLKPENILVDENYYPRVCDFGLSRCFSKNLTKSIQLSMTGKIGTPLYMAPELMEDEDHYGPGIDVYAFAILAYEIVTQQEPFFEHGKKIKFADLFRKVRSGGRPKFTDGVTEKMKNLIQRCWSHDSKDRPSFDEIFNELSSDFSYLDEDVDGDEITNYLEELKDNEELIPQIPSVDEFNELKNKCKELEKICDEKEFRNKELKDESEKLKDEIIQLKKEKKSKDDDIKKMQNEISQLKSEKESKDDDIKKLKDEISQLKAEKESKDDDIKKMQNEISQLKSEKESKDDDIKKMQNEISQLKKEKESKDDDIKKMQNEISQLKAEKESKDDDIKKLKDEISQLKSKIETKDDIKKTPKEISPLILDEGSMLKEIESLYKSLSQCKDLQFGKHIKIPDQHINYVCQKSIECLKRDSMLLQIKAPIKILGSIHGQFNTFKKFIEKGGNPANTRYLLLGNYVDKGMNSVETITIILCLKILYPDNIFLLRGDHEFEAINQLHGFYDECLEFYDENVWKSFNNVFGYLPLAAIIEDKMFCVHSGISKHMKSPFIINDMKRPLMNIQEEGLIYDLLNSNPDPEINGYKMSFNEDGKSSIDFGADAVNSFINTYDYDLIVRSHQVVPDGYEFPFFPTTNLVTIFSAANYDDFENNGSMLIVNDKLNCSFEFVIASE